MSRRKTTPEAPSAEAAARSKPKVISLFTGAGGIDYGLEAAGFETAVAVERDHDCCETLRHNRPWEVIERDIFQVPTAELLERGGLKIREADLLVGGPPCQPFSKAGYWSRGDSLRLDDPRSNTLSAYLRVLEETLPQAFLVENVEGLAFSGKDEGLRLLMTQIEAINERTGSHYAPVMKVVSAAEHGVPQLRERVILIAARDGTRLEFPKPTHRSPDEKNPDLFRRNEPTYRTAWDAIGDVHPDADENLELRGKWADLLPSIPEGSNYLHHTARGEGEDLFGWRRRYWSFLLKLAKNLPSWTIQAQPGPAIGPFHWKNRRLSMREMCRLQTFPDNVTITGGRTSQQRQLGNAVPSLLAEVLGRAIGQQLLKVPLPEGAFKLLPEDRSPPPKPEDVVPMPRKFRKLIGEHEAHPGTGKGYGARSRQGALA